MIEFESRENELLVCLLRPSVDAERVRELIQSDLDWDYLLAAAQRHSVSPLLYYRLNSACPEAVPSVVLSRLKARDQKNTKQSLFLTGELLNLLRQLETHDIPAVAFKGPTLALAAYGDLALREFGDLDVLIRKRDVLRVRELLAGAGFKPTPELSDAQEAALFQFDCACNFGNDKNVLFDVHWDFAAPQFSLKLDVDRIWERLEQTTIGKDEVPTLSREDLLLVLCLHGSTHLWERLGWICDVAGLIERSENINWPLVMDDATRQGCRRILLLGLKLASDLLQVGLPNDVLEATRRDQVVSELADHLQKRLFAYEPASGVLDESILQLRMRERLRDKVKSGVRLTATPRSYDWSFLKLPRWLFFLYYPLRPLRLAGKYGARLIGRSQQ